MKSNVIIWGITAILFGSVGNCFGNASLQSAQLLYSRIAGVKLSYSSPVLLTMKTLLDKKKYSSAADVALNSDDFYNITLFQFFAPLSTRSEAPDVELNDMIAMGIANTFVDLRTGKDRPFTELLTGDFTVRFNNSDLALNNNEMLSKAFRERIVLTPKNLTIKYPQRSGLSDAAGVLTSRQFLKEHAQGGTNRRLVHFAFREFLCTDIKEWRDADQNISDDYVARDVNRAPGGGRAGMNVYQSDCRSCHQVQDGLRNAFAFHDFDAQSLMPIYRETVSEKINKNILFDGGFVVSDDSWENRAIRNGNSQRFGWRGALSGKGARAFGQMIANSEKFSICTVERVFKQLCKRPLNSNEDSLKRELARKFENDDYSLRGLFRNIAINPKCFQIGEGL